MLTEARVHWVEIAEHFQNLGRTMKRKFQELEANEKEYDEKEVQINAMLVDKEVGVIAKEQALADRLHELKDAAVAAIFEARLVFHLWCLLVVARIDISKVSSSLGELSPPEEYVPPKMSGEVGVVVVEPCPVLLQFCQQMDVKGLLGFVMASEKTETLLKKLSAALIQPISCWILYGGYIFLW